MNQRNAVLFVDDEIQVLNALKRGLLDQPYSRYFATSGKDALHILEKQKISVIVTDMRMPEMNGLQLLREVNLISPRTVKIVLTGYLQINQVLATINNVDVFRIVAKPWDLENELIDIIQQAINYYQLQEVNDQLLLDLEKRNKAYQQILTTLNMKMATIKRHSEIMGKVGHEMLVYDNENQLKDDPTGAWLRTIRVPVFDALMKSTLRDAPKIDILTLFEQVADSLKGVKLSTKPPTVPLDNEMVVNTDLWAAILKIGLLVFREETKEQDFELAMELTTYDRVRLLLSAKNPADCKKEQVELKLRYYNQVIGGGIRAGGMNCYVEYDDGRLCFVVVHSIESANEKEPTVILK